MTQDLKSAAAKLIEASEKATAGPWVAYEETHGRWYVEGITDGGLFRSDAEFIALARNTAPPLARALLAAMDVVEAARRAQGDFEVLHIQAHGCPAVPPEMGDVCLALARFDAEAGE